MKSKSELFKVFSNEIRLKIFEFLLNGRMCVSGIVDKFNVTQPTITQHLRVLQHAGLVKAERIGNWMHYSIDGQGLARVKKELERFAGTLKVKEKKCPVSASKCPVK